ncbi:MAG: PAS domain-containing protein [Thermoanaerobaculia bacterium]|nr:PAS domain-containing protein [Thermoanaerobaculia bacterium]
MTLSAPPPPSPVRRLLRQSVVPLLLSLAGGLVAGVVFNRVLDRAIAGRTEAGAFALLSRVGPDLETLLASGKDPREAVDLLGRQLSLRATLVAVDGRVLGDSGVEQGRIDALENHASRPEIAEAHRSGSGVRTRFSSTIGDRLVYAAVRLRGGEVLRIAFREKELAAWEAPFRRQTTGLSVLAGLLVAALLVYARARRAAELRLVREAVSAVERGRGLPEPGRVSDEAAEVFSALGDLAALAAERDAAARRDALLARAVFDEVPVGLLVVDPRLTLLDANAEALRLLGTEAGAPRPGGHVLELFRDKTLSDLLASALEHGRAAGPLFLSVERGARRIEASALRVSGEAKPGQPAAIALLREPAPPSAG